MHFVHNNRCLWRSKPPWGRRGFSREYVLRISPWCRKRRLNGAVCRNHRMKRVVKCRCLDGHVKETYEMSLTFGARPKVQLLPQSTCTYMCCHMYDWNIVDCNVKQPIQKLKVEKVYAKNIEGVAALVSCDFYQAISFIDELSVSKLFIYDFPMVLCVINMQKIEKLRLRWKKLRLRLGFVLFVFSTYWPVNE